MVPQLPHVSRYLATLPRGLDSYPELSIKASVLRSSLDHRPLSSAIV